MTSDSSTSPQPTSQTTQSIGVLLATVLLGLIVAGGWLAVQWRQAAASLVEAKESLRKYKADLDDIEEDIASATEARSREKVKSHEMERTQPAEGRRPTKDTPNHGS